MFSLKDKRNCSSNCPPDEKKVVTILKEKEPAHIDHLRFETGLTSSATAAAILNLELRNVVLSLPGKLYRLA